jgi:hypothetical protein
MISGRCNILKEWEGWDPSIHNDEEQIARQGRSMTYPFEFKISKIEKIANFSSHSDIPFYTTSLHECNCYDFQGRKLPCKHMYRLAKELDIIDIINRPSFDKEKVAEVKKSNDIDQHPDQLKRIESAKKSATTPTKVDHENKTAEFKGSGKSPYITTLDSCTCRDYVVRRLPCKHIYRLRFELEGTDVERGTNKNEYASSLDLIYKIPVESQKILYHICDYSLSICERNECIDPLIHNDFCVELDFSVELLENFSAAKIKQILNASFPDREDLPAKTSSQKSCIAWIRKNYDSVSPIIEKSYIFLKNTERTEFLQSKIKHGYEKKFIKEETPKQYYYGTQLIEYSSQELIEYYSQE